MKYVLTPLNEGQEMNCHVKFNGNKRDAVKRATGIAAGLQAHLGENSITCRIRRAGRGFEITDENGLSIIATPVGKLLNETTGGEVSL